MATEYTPKWAPHVVALISDEDEDGKIEIEMICKRCKARHRVVCESRQPRTHVRSFGHAHYECKGA